jgi:hypothetical protein
MTAPLSELADGWHNLVSDISSSISPRRHSHHHHTTTTPGKSQDNEPSAEQAKLCCQYT